MTTTANPNPYRYLGNEVTGETDLYAILASGGAEFNVTMTPVQVDTPIGTVVCDTHRAVVRDDTSEILAVHTKGYTPIQYREVTEMALEAVGLRPNDAALKYLGTINDGKQFYATIDLGSLVLDPSGIADKISKYLVAFASHDGTLPVMFAESNLRVLCSNQAPAIRAQGKAGAANFRVKHTKNMRERLAIAREALGIADAAAAAFLDTAEKMLSIKCSKSDVLRIAEQMWPLKGDSDRAKTVHTRRLATIESLWGNSTNSGAVGDNGWAAFNTFTEFLDHGRGTNADKRAIGTVVPGSWVEASKTEAAGRVLALA